MKRDSSNKTETSRSVRPTVAAVLNTSADVVDLLRRSLEQAGIVTVTGFTHEIRDGAIDFDAFIGQHNPDLIVYDIAPPYDANWRLFQHLSRRPVATGRQFVLTATNAAHVENLSPVISECTRWLENPRISIE